jgi:hypothetical protein
MWTLSTFQKLRALLGDQKTCLLTNYTRATYVRVTLLLAGFFVGVGRGIHEKEETTVFSNRFEDLEHPLDLKWLETRVKISHSAAVLRSAPYKIAPIAAEDFEALQEHPQFKNS